MDDRQWVMEERENTNNNNITNRKEWNRKKKRAFKGNWIELLAYRICHIQTFASIQCVHESEREQQYLCETLYTFKAVVQVQHEHTKQIRIRPEEGILLLCCVFVVIQLSFFLLFVDVQIICSETDYFPYRLGIWRDMDWNTLFSYRIYRTLQITCTHLAILKAPKP